MARLTAPHRLSPPLMWAFRDAHQERETRKSMEAQKDQGEVVVPGRRSAPQASVNEIVLRREVWRDLELLLNTISLESSEPAVAEFAEVRNSVLNFGLPDMTHRAMDELKRNDNAVEREMEGALQAFEPRLLQGSVRVKRDVQVDAAELKLRYVIRADLSCKPVDIPVEFTAEVELDSGKVVVNRL